jgi:hypothetical protein
VPAFGEPRQLAMILNEFGAAGSRRQPSTGLSGGQGDDEYGESG